MDQNDLQPFIKKIECATTHEEQLIRILNVYLEAFPSVLDAYLFRFSPLGFLTEGIVAKTANSQMFHIRNIRDDIRTVPMTYNAVRTRKALIISKEDFITYNQRYTFSAKSSFLTVTPISFSSNVVGILHSTRFSADESEIKKLLPAFTSFGRLVGRVLESTNYNFCETTLSNREIQVMQKLAWGNSTKMIADSLDISEHTVNDYIRSAISKLNAHNRTEAVAILIRKGIIN